jgi:hypothetical protein
MSTSPPRNSWARGFRSCESLGSPEEPLLSLVPQKPGCEWHTWGQQAARVIQLCLEKSLSELTIEHEVFPLSLDNPKL